MKVPWREQEWQRVAVYGLGASGLAATRLLRSRGVEVVGVDMREGHELDLGDLEKDPGFDALLGGDPQELLERIDGVVISPGVSPRRPLIVAAREAGLPVVAEVELAYLFADGPLIGITGSNGKSTTTLMTGELLKAAGFAVEICGNIGVPLSARVDGEAGRIFVTELSSFQLEAVDTFRPQAAAMLNLSADHLDRHRDHESYFAAKRNLFDNQQSTDVAVLNADDEQVAAVAVPARRRFFSRRRQVDDGCYLDGEIVVEVDPETGRHPLFSRGDVPVPGPHNLENAMAAALLSRAAGADPEVFPSALAKFQGLPHRLQRVADQRGVVWYDDSKATNFAATLRSLEGFADGSVHLIVGGRNKGGDPAVLTDVVRRKVCRLYLVGEAAVEIGAALAGVVGAEMAGTLETAVEAAARRAGQGEVVLLSPSCASFDQYQSFAERGDHFQILVRGLDG